MISRTALRSMLAANNGNANSVAVRLLSLMGLVDGQGRPHVDHAGNAQLRDPLDATGRPVARLRPNEISLRVVAESFMGESAIERWLRPNLIRDMAERGVARRELAEGEGQGAQMPSHFANINAWTGVAVGLMQVGILEGYNRPQYIADELAPVEATTMFEGRKSIGIIPVGDSAEERLPGMPTKRVNVGERWIEQPRTVENSLAIELTQEAAYLDITGDLNTQANDIGTWLGYRKDVRVINAFIGVPGLSQYRYKGNGYAPYLSSGYYVNDITGADLTYPESVKKAQIAFRNMKDPDTGTPVVFNPNRVLCQTERLDTASALFSAQSLMYRNAPATTAAERQYMVQGDSTYRGLGWQVMPPSPILFDRLTAADGLNLSQTQAGTVWFAWEPGGLVYAQNWPLRVQTAIPNSVEMLDRGLVLFVKADERGIPFWKQPRKHVRCQA